MGVRGDEEDERQMGWRKAKMKNKTVRDRGRRKTDDTGRGRQTGKGKVGE